MKITIVDDLQNERQTLISYLTQMEKEKNMEFEITEYENAESFLCAYDEGMKTDLLFLDIFMGKMSGMEAAKTLYNSGFTGLVVFTTTSMDFAVQSYDVEAVGYLVKPYDYTAFCRTIERCRDQWHKSRKTISFVSERIECTIFISDIVYIETDRNSSIVHAKGEKLKTRKQISEFGKELAAEASFIRMGKSYIINLNNISSTGEEHIYFKNGDRIAFPVRDKGKIKKQIADYYWQMTRE